MSLTLKRTLPAQTFKTAKYVIITQHMIRSTLPIKDKSVAQLGLNSHRYSAKYSDNTNSINSSDCVKKTDIILLLINLYFRNIENKGYISLF